MARFTLRIRDTRRGLDIIEVIELQPRDYLQHRDARELFFWVMQRVRSARWRLRHRWRKHVLGDDYVARLGAMRAKREAMKTWERLSAPHYSGDDLIRERRAFASYLEERYGATPAREAAR